MLTVLTLLKLNPSPNGEKHGERAFWREWGAIYLDRWIWSVRKYVPEPKRIVVMTDANGMQSGVEVAYLDQDVDAPGFWAKLNMFRTELATGKCLYCDLDNVINGPLDELCALEPDPLIMLDDRRVPGLPNGSLILFDADRCRDIWDSYAMNPRHWEREYVAGGDNYWHAYDQAFIADWFEDNNPTSAEDVPLFQHLLPEGYILNARSELPNASDWQSSRLIFGGGAEGKMHLNPHPGFSLRSTDASG